MGEMAALLKRFGSAALIWGTSSRDLRAAGLHEDAADNLVRQRGKKDPLKLAEFCQKENVSITAYYEKNYPRRLLETGHAPLALFVKGRLPADEDKIAIVGSRKASAYAIAAAKQFAADLSRAGFVIVSGGARGADTSAHQGALAENGRTVAVFGCGIDVCYPKENKKLYEAIVAGGGALVTEYLPGDPPAGWRFPARNRIISGLCEGVLVVEASKKSGSLITADFAAEKGREVYCVPGSIYSPGSAGVHNLIKQGAKLADCPEDIIADLGRLFVSSSRTAAVRPEELTGNAKKIHDSLLSGKNYSVDEIIETTGLDPAETAFSLLEMEISGRIEANAGMYRRIERGGR
ncbi:MAG: DNA-processing protein DprA [Acidaminococcales bacterium]|nr:DNA-processing protein DprA [Acidaminococcales bacterium]